MRGAVETELGVVLDKGTLTDMLSKEGEIERAGSEPWRVSGARER